MDAVVTMRIFVMGLAAVFSRDNKGIDILLPTDAGHYPVMVFTCKEHDKTCATKQAADVAGELMLPDPNLDNDGLLAFRNSHFGAVKLKDPKGIKISIYPPPMPVNAPASRLAGRHHNWPMSMWYHLAGEVPRTAQEAKDASWLVSLKDILPCATPKALGEMTGDDTLAAYMSSTSTSLGDPIVASLSGLMEYTDGRCSGSGEIQEYAVTLDFNPSSLFTRQDQAGADAFYYLVTVDPSVKIRLDTSSGPIDITPYTDPYTGFMDILIANLTEYNSVSDVCYPRYARHGPLYNKLLHLPSGCSTVPIAEMGWESTRTPKSALDRKNLADILGVVSFKNPGRGHFIVPTEGTARPVCYTLAN